MAERKRNKEIHFYVTEEERKLIRRKMIESKTKNMGAYLRKMAIDGWRGRPCRGRPPRKGPRRSWRPPGWRSCRETPAAPAPGTGRAAAGWSLWRPPAPGQKGDIFSWEILHMYDII